MNIRKNDVVEVITGEEKGKRGKVMRIVRGDKGEIRIIIEGLNLAKKHQRTKSAQQPGGIIDLPNPIHASNVVLICPKCGKKAKIHRDKAEEKRIRICRQCEEVID